MCVYIHKHERERNKEEEGEGGGKRTTRGVEWCEEEEYQRAHQEEDMPAASDPKQFQGWFHAADADGDGRVNGTEAVAFFGRSGLSQKQLAKIWVLADQKRQGSLNLKNFALALWLIGNAQEGLPMTVDAVNEGEKITPKLDGVNAGDIDEALAKKIKGIRVSEPAEDEIGVRKKKGASFFKATAKMLSKTVKLSPTTCSSISEGLKLLYTQKIAPLEKEWKFNDFEHPALTESDFEARPMVMLLGQYSVGKTTFIKYLLDREYPQAQIGPEPTTDRFVAVMHSHDERITPGNTLAVQANRPFTGTTRFGTAFLNKFIASECPAELLEAVTIIDTPGVLSGEKQRIDRNYEFPQVTHWFASKVDMILLLFDPHKLDISDEFRRVIQSLQGNEDKIKIVLNKSDQIDTQHLMRVYGALMWSLSRVIKTPEVMRVYIGNFNDQPYRYKGMSELLDQERVNLMTDLMDIPRRTTARRVNELVKRLRGLKIHIYILANLKSKMPSMMGKEKKQQKLIAGIAEIFREVQTKHDLPFGDFPNMERFQEKLQVQKFDKFPKFDPKTIAAIDTILSEDLPQLLEKFGNPFDAMDD